MCIAAKYIRETRNGRTLEREILLPNPKVFSPKSVGAVAIVNTCFGIRAAMKDLKKTRRKETYLFRGFDKWTQLQLQLVVRNMTDVADWIDAYPHA